MRRLNLKTKMAELVQDWTGDFVVEETVTTTRNVTAVGSTAEAGTTAQGQANDVLQDFTDEFAVVQDPVKALEDAEVFRETNPHRVAQRQRQIDFGKNTVGYQRMTEAHPIKKKRPNTVPRTPDVHKKCSKRAFDGLVRQWRRRLHEWDLQEGGAGMEPPTDPRLRKMDDSNKRCRDERDGRGGRSGKMGNNESIGVGEKTGDFDDEKAGKKTDRKASPVKRGGARVAERSACGVELDFAAED
jgi:hypothetical protein